NGILAKLRENRQKTLDYRGAYFMSILATRLSNYFDNYTTTQGYLTANLRQKYEIEKSHLNDAFVIAGGTDTILRTNNVYSRQKLRNNYRELQKMYDAKYHDSRDGKQKASKEVISERTRPSKKITYDNLRQFRKKKVKKDLVSIRKGY